MWVQPPIGIPGALAPGAPQTPRSCGAMKWYEMVSQRPQSAPSTCRLHIHAFTHLCIIQDSKSALLNLCLTSAMQDCFYFCSLLLLLLVNVV